MSHWIGNSIFIVAIVTSIIIRIPHDKVSQKTGVATSRWGLVEKLLLALMMMGMLLMPILSFTPLLAFAGYNPSLQAVVAGTLLMLLSLWLFHKSHKDLGRNWSVSLEIREDHSLVTGGVYRTIRHPMYTSIFLMAIGQFLLLSNWIAGPAMFVAFTLMFISRLRTEEQMMLDLFGDNYEAYRQNSKRLIPWVW